MSKAEFYPEIGDVLVIDDKRYVLFDYDFDHMVSINGGTRFNVAYYFISEETIVSKKKIELSKLRKNEKAIILDRDEGFDIKMRTDDHYDISNCISLVFKKKE